MHRVDSENATAANLFSDGPPGTRLGALWHNAVQEEIAYCVEQAGLTLSTSSADDYQQLKEAIEILAQAAAGMPTGTEAWFYQDTPPTGWTLDATPADAVLAVKGGANAYNANGGTQQGTWTQPNHTHGTSGISVDAHTHAGTGTLTLAHTHDPGDFTLPNHLHAAGTLAMPNHIHVLDFDTETSSATITWGDQVYADSSGNTLHMRTATYVGGGASPLYRQHNWTQSDGGAAIVNDTATTGGTAISGTATGAASDSTVNGSTGTASTDGISGNTDTSATAATYRPLAQLGIICTKD